MRRDWDLIRRMVLAVEDSPGGFARDLVFEGHTDAEIGYHAYLLVDAGLAEGADATARGSEGPEWLLTHLTWKGHEFAEAARNESQWKKAMKIVREKGGSVTFPVLSKVLGDLVGKAMGV